MRAVEFRLGQRVRRRANEGSFVKDRNTNPALKGRRIGVVIGLPELMSPRILAVRVQWEGSTRFDEVAIHRLEALPLKEQPIALGGQWHPPKSPLLAGRC